MTHGAIKVSLTLYTSIVFARGIFELDAGPVARCELGLADKTDDTCPAIAEPDGLPDCKLRHFVVALWRSVHI